MVTGRPTLRYQALIGLIASLMVACLLASLSGFWRLEPGWDIICLIAAVTVLFSLVAGRLPWLGGLLASVTLGGAVVLTRYSPDWALYVQQLLAEWGDFWAAIRLFKFDTTFGPSIGLVFLVAIGLGTSLFLVNEVLLRGKAFWSIALGILIFGTQWAWYYNKSETYFAAYLVLAFALWILGQAARRDAGWLSSGRRVGYKSHITTPIAWVLIAAMVAAILPSEFSPLDLGALGQSIQNTFPILKKMRGAGVGAFGGRFSLRGTGFSPTMGALGGPVELDHSLALQLTSPRRLTETAYLRGATYAEYDGASWQPGESRDVQIPTDGVLPSGYFTDVMLEDVTVKITPAVNMGQTLFNLLEPKKVDALNTTFTLDTDGNLWAKRAVNKGTPYQITSRVPLYSAEQIRLLSTSSPSDSFAQYLQRPATMPRRVTDLANSITATHEHPFDKAVALEAYLRGFEYDLNVSAAPAGRDFVDYFLFDLQRGYCTYYATAMAIMLREVGIPSRLVEGFAVPASLDTSTDAQGGLVYDVLNSQAHAWVEAYFPGYGWVTFEPTPRGDIGGIDRSRPLPQSPSIDNTGSSTPTTPPDDLSEGDDPNRRPDDTLDDGTTGGAGATAQREWPWGLAAALAVGLVLAAGYRRLSALNRIASTSEREVVQEVWDKTGHVMERFDYGRKPHQTAREYAAALGKAWPSLREPTMEVAEEYTAARYSAPGTHVGSNAHSKARELWQKVLHALFTHYGWRGYLWRRLGWKKGSDRKTGP